MPASYPTSIKSFTTKLSGDIIQAAHVNDLQDEVTATETGLISGIAHVLRPDGATRDFGTTGFRWRDLFAGRTIDIDQGTITIDAQVWKSIATWNAGAVTFVHKDTNITDTASAAASILERWRVGGVVKAEIRKDGQLTVGSLALTGSFVPSSDNTLDIGSTPNRWRDLFVGRTINVTQGTLTTSTPFLSGTATWNNGAITFVGASFNVTDTASAVDSLLLRLQKGGLDAFLVRKDGQLSLGGSIQFLADNTVDIGATASARPRDVYVGTSVRVGATVAAGGAIRLPHLSQILWRNSANTADFGITGEGVASNIELVAVALTGEVDGTRDLGSLSKRWRDIFAATSVRVGTTVASSGTVRLANNTNVSWRNGANTSDLHLFMNAGDNLTGVFAAFLPDSDIVRDLGSPTLRWRTAHLGGVNFRNTENLRIIRGRIDTTAPTILQGGGFTVVRNGIGDITITFTQGFGGIPSVTTSGEVVSGLIISVVTGAPTVTTARIVRGTIAGVAEDGIIHFGATGTH